MAGGTQEDVHVAFDAAGGPDTPSMSFLTTDDQERALRDDVQRVRSSPYLGNRGGRSPTRRREQAGTHMGTEHLLLLFAQRDGVAATPTPCRRSASTSARSRPGWRSPSDRARLSAVVAAAAAGGLCARVSSAQLRRRIVAAVDTAA